MSQPQKKFVQKSILDFIKPKQSQVETVKSQPVVNELSDSNDKSQKPITTQLATVSQELHQQKFPVITIKSPQPVVSRPTSPNIPKPQSSPALNSPSIDISFYQNNNTSPTANLAFTAQNLSDLDTTTSSNSPGQRQYAAIRKTLDPQTVLFLQNGAFYELYDSDGFFGVEKLGLKGVKKSTGQFVAGIPRTNAGFYFTKTLGMNRRVAICDQFDDQDKEFKVQRRQITRILSPGVVESEGDKMGLIYVTQQIGFDVYVLNPVQMKVEHKHVDNIRDVQQIVCFAKPAEIITDITDLYSHLNQLVDFPVQILTETYFDQYTVQTKHKKDFNSPPFQNTPKLLQQYMKYLNTEPNIYVPFKTQRKTCSFPFTTFQTLELLKVERVFSQFIQSRFGKRTFHQLMMGPFCQLEDIQKMQKLVKENRNVNLKGIVDIQLFKYDLKQAGQVLNSLQKVIAIFKEIGCEYQILADLKNVIDCFSDPAQLILNSTDQQTSNSMKSGIKKKQLQFLNSLQLCYCSDVTFEKPLNSNAAKMAIAIMDNQLIVGKSLVSDKVLAELKRNHTYIDSTNQIHKFELPAELKLEMQEAAEYEAQMINKAVDAVYALVQSRFEEVQTLYDELAYMDLAQAFNKLKNKHPQINWSTPVFSQKISVDVKNAVHPLMLGRTFTPQSYNSDRMSLLTGPNMSGKSTFLRTIAISIILAQIGCDVPCESMHLGVFDNVLCRIGGYDFGNSTFQSEMIDCNQLITMATPQSFVIIDEIGRGTEAISSDALSQAILKYFVKQNVVGVISTHSNQLNLCAQLMKLQTYEMEFILSQKQIKFTYQLKPLESNQMSLGCEVAAMAGIADSIIARAKLMREDRQQQIENECRKCIQDIIEK
ncbi:Mismatch_repair protein [Hexamita inflata]|uniref:Mismatch repair protein n=1 Tax=Hexamita inflata TaxID=28002 RepID=A0AA86TWR6_9EUKA|nr:Mismatch repair protein [Hexamita inflata]